MPFAIRTLVLLTVTILFMGCKGLQVATNKTPANTPDIGVELIISDERADPAVERGIDSIFNAAITNFNNSTHAFKLHKKLKKDKDYFSIEVQKAKKIKWGGKAVGYVVSAIGLALPVVLIAEQSAYVFAFVYLPQHKIFSSLQLSPSLTGDGAGKQFMNVWKSALFGSNKRQIPKLLKRFDESLNRVFVAVEKKLVANASGVVK